jgi:hypothetical protein
MRSFPLAILIGLARTSQQRVFFVPGRIGKGQVQTAQFKKNLTPPDALTLACALEFRRAPVAAVFLQQRLF